MLPVDLVGFYAEPVEEKVLLNWMTTSEKDFDYFSIERSQNGFNFEPIGKIQTDGDSEVLKHYNFVDSNPFSNKNYYRLKMVDIGGTFTFSKVVVVNLNKDQLTSQFSIIPNPNKGVFSLQFEQVPDENLHISVYSITGQKVKSYILNDFNTNRFPMDLSNLKSGVYMVQISSPQNQLLSSQKLVIQR